MSNASPKKETEKEYFKQLLQKSKSASNGENEMNSMIKGSMRKIEEQLQSGNLAISNKSKAQEQLSKIKQEKYAKQMEILNRQLTQNDEMYKKARRELLLQKKTEHQLKKTTDDTKIKQVGQKVKKWSEIQKDLKEKRELMQQAKQALGRDSQQRMKRQSQEQKQFQKLEKKKQIEQSLKKIEQNKLKRDEISKSSEHQIQQLQPKFVEIEKKFKQLEEQLKFQQEILKKNHKLSLKIDHEAIKAHERAYLTKIQERKAFQSESQSPRSADGTRQKDFNQFYARNEQKLAEQKEKVKRRKEFQQKLKEIPVIIDEAKKVKVQIAIDKGRNRIKYNFLGQKALNDFQIFGEFRDFELNVNPRELGKEYLRQLPEITKSSRVAKSNSTSSLKETEKSEKIKYKDYLQELKTQRSQRGATTEEEITQILKNHKSKSKAISQLSEKSKQYQLQARKKMQQMQKYNGLQSVLKKSKQVDDIYLKSIKAKLACLEMQE